MKLTLFDPASQGLRFGEPAARIAPGTQLVRSIEAFKLWFDAPGLAFIGSWHNPNRPYEIQGVLSLYNIQRI